MGAPFWSKEEKQYFLQYIVPRSHYANGYYEPDGRSFEDLASVMQRDLDGQSFSRRTYNGDLLFQHWYQKVRPTFNMPPSLTQGPPPSLSTSSQQHDSTVYQPIVAQTSVDANTRSSPSLTTISDNEQFADISDNDLTLSEDNFEEDLTLPEVDSENDLTISDDLSMAESTSAEEASKAQDKASKTEPASESAAESPSKAANPSAAVPSTAPARAAKKRAASKGEPAQVASKKPKKAAKKSTVQVEDSSDSDDDDVIITIANPRPVANTRVSSPRSATRAYESPYVPITNGPSLAAARELLANSTAIGNARIMLQQQQQQNQARGPISGFESQRHSLPSSQMEPLTPFTQEDAEVGRSRRRHAMTAFNTGLGYRGPGQAHPTGSGTDLGPHGATYGGGPYAGGAHGGVHGKSYSGEAHGGGAHGGRAHAGTHQVAGERMGEVTLHGTTMLPSCPFCRRDF